jgi:hypothetical protein
LNWLVIEGWRCCWLDSAGAITLRAVRGIADELRPAIEAVLDDLDAWLTPRYGPGQQEPRDGGCVQQHHQP